MLRIRITRGVKPIVPLKAPDSVALPAQSNAPCKPLITPQQAGQLLAELTEQEVLEFPADYEGLNNGIDLLQEQRLEFLEYGDPLNPQGLMSVYRIRYLSSSNGEYFEYRPFADDGRPGLAEKFVNPQELKNALCSRMRLQQKQHPKIKLAEIANIKLKLFGFCW